MGLTDKLVKFATADVPEEAAAMIRLSLFDWAACGIAGAQDGALNSFRQAQLVEEGPAHVFGGDAAGAAQAALINGTLSHALDFDDVHFAYGGNPSVVVLPAVIALAETLDVRLTDAVDAATLGIEAAIMVGVWLGGEHSAAGFDVTATAGAFGATLAAARVLGLDKPQTRHAIDLCASMASGLAAQEGSTGRALSAGLAARTGVEAALWAQVGMTGPDKGAEGFGAAHHAEVIVVKPPRKEWQVSEITHKFHACCHGVHATIEALSAAKISADRIAGIKIRTNPRWIELCNNASPKNGRDAQFSYTQAAAMAVLGYSTGRIDAFSDEIMRDKDVRAVRNMTEVTADESLSSAQVLITLTLESGEVRRLRHDLQSPMSLENRAAKLREKVKGLLGETREEALWQAVIGPELDAVTACFGTME
ncbi:MAG: MmgE/PrpD family protein [Sulfitobacter sp.]